MKNLQRTLWFPPAVIFLAVMVVVVGSFFVARNSIASERNLAFEKYATGTEVKISNRLKLIEETLYAGAGYFAANDAVDRQGWRDFISSSTILERFDGVQGIGYATIIEPAELGPFEQRTNIGVTPKGERDIYTSIIYLEPLDARNKKAIGYDMFSEDVRRDAMERARDNGKAAASSAVTLVQENGIDQQRGFLLYIPQYEAGEPIGTVEERRTAIRGYVYAVFRTKSFIENSLTETDTNLKDLSAGFELYSKDISDNDKVFMSNDYSQIISKAHAIEIRKVTVEGADWTFKYVYKPDKLLTQAFSQRPMTILFFGTFAALLITTVTFLLIRVKSHELELVQERETNKAKDSLLSIASHQLRTPATGVKQYLGMVIQGFVGDVSKSQSDMLNKAYESNERQLRTINDVLFLARLDSGRIILSKSKVELNGLVNSVIEEQRDHINESNHTIKVKLPKNKIYADADEHMIRMSVENILSNAIKYTKNGGKISVSLSQKKSETTIAIKDNGVGIAQENQDKLFKQFSRIKNELSKSVSGTGIGLYLVRHIVELHNGSVNVESSEGKGSTFTISIPSTKAKL